MASTQKAAREALRSLNWPLKQTKEHKYKYFRRGRDRRGKRNNNMCNKGTVGYR